MGRVAPATGVGGQITRWLGAMALATALVAAGCATEGGEDGEHRGSVPASAVESATRPPVTRPVTRPEGAGPARYAGFRSETYADKAHWVCRPDLDDVCDGQFDTTVVEASGRLTLEPYEPATDPLIDCFYVYPTISRDPTPTSDLTASSTDEGLATAAQVGRLGEHCRIFAPTYRQVTATALRSILNGKPMPGIDEGLGYRDVLEAWKHYLANDNGGRGVVLVGHSQGASVLTQLIKEEIDPHPEVRRFLVSAFLAGTAVRVPPGADIGGEFANVPLCRGSDQLGCVVSWSSFRADPGAPATARFGRARDGGGVAACVNPAALAGGRAPLRGYFGRTPGMPNAANGGTAGGERWIDPAKGSITTNYVSLPGLVEGECVQRNGVSYLAITVKGDPGDPRADDIGGDLSPDWGLHLIDINLVLGDLVDLVGRQVEVFERSAESK